jgi:DNA polymerase sigma
MTELCSKISPTAEQYVEQRNFLNRLQETVSGVLPGGVVSPFGSAVNGFWSPDSDIDVCIQTPGCRNRAAQIQALRTIASSLHSVSSHQIEPRFSARVPIIHWAPRKDGYLACDISINNNLAVINSRLIGAYSNIDPRFPLIGRVIKHWAKSRSINDRSRGTLSSFSLLLMLIHFLQKRSILPSLQDLALELNLPLMYCDGVDVRFVSDRDLIDREMTRLRVETEDNECIGALLYDFFRFYAHDYHGGIISVRDLRGFSCHDDSTSRMYIVDNPFEVGKDVANVSPHQYARLRQEFRRVVSIIKTENPENILDSICSSAQPPRPNSGFPRRLPGSHPLDPPVHSLGRPIRHH